jgi:hypothetical protein
VLSAIAQNGSNVRSQNIGRLLILFKYYIVTVGDDVLGLHFERTASKLCKFFIWRRGERKGGRGSFSGSVPTTAGSPFRRQGKGGDW